MGNSGLGSASAVDRLITHTSRHGSGVVANDAIDPPAFAACAPEVKQFVIARIHDRTLLNCMD